MWGSAPNPAPAPPSPQDPSFWEKVLGPRPADQVLSELHEDASMPSHVLRDPVRTAQWAADLGALLDDVFLSRCDGTPHEAYETVQSVLIELQVLRDTPPHPLSKQGTRLRAAAAATAERAATASLSAAFPPPCPAVMALVRSEVGQAAMARSRWAAGRGEPPEEDGDLAHYAGTLADFARYWVDRLEQVGGQLGGREA